MQKSLYIDPEKCTGCLQCEMACSFEQTGVFNPAQSRIKVFTFEEEGRKVPYTCTQCDEAWCMQACPVDSIKLDATTGAKVVQDDTCVGCKVCTILVHLGPSITWSTQVKSPSVTCVVVIRRAPRRAQPTQLLSWIRVGLV